METGEWHKVLANPGSLCSCHRMVENTNLNPYPPSSAPPYHLCSAKKKRRRKKARRSSRGHLHLRLVGRACYISDRFTRVRKTIMKFPRKLALVSVVVAAADLTGVFAQETKPTPLTVRKIVDEAVQEVRKNRRTFDEANRKVLADAEKKLYEELDRITKTGVTKLDDAVTTREVIRTLAESVTERADAPMPPVLAGPPPMDLWVIGKWSGLNTPHVFGFSDNGGFEGIGKAAEAKNWRGAWKSERHGYIDVDVQNGGRWEIRRCGPNAMAVVVYTADNTQSGDGFVLFRQLDPIVGKWKWFNEGVHEFCGDGQIIGTAGAIWSVVDPAKRGYMVKWGDGKHVDMLFLSADGLKLSGKNDKGVEISAERVK